MRHYYLLICIVCINLLSSCTLIDKKEEIPAYLKIDSIDFKSTNPLQGTNNQNITEAWVFVDDDLQGIYDLPCEVPILKLGAHQVKVRGGIKRNLNSFLRIDNPFFTTYSTDVVFENLKTVELKPVVNYFSDVTIWEESFEDAGVKIITTSDSDTSIFITTNKPEVFEGNGTGKIVFPADKQLVKVRSNQRFKFPVGEPIFIEVHYRTTADMIVGLVTHPVSGGEVYDAIVGLKNTNGSWKKGYINLSEYVNRQASSSEFDIFFSISHSSSQQLDSAYLDNIKVLYPKR